MIKSWSFSRLSDFEQCKYRAKLKYVDNIPEPIRELAEGKTEHANDRGTRIHAECEEYVRGTRKEIPKEASSYEAELKSLRQKFIDGKAELEGEWGFDNQWNVCAYKSKEVWLRVKCDAVIHLSPTHILVVDFKTGRKFGNEIKHGEQVQLYALAAAVKFPNAKTIDVELWYFDQKDGENYTHESKPADKWLYHLKLFTNRGNKLLSATAFEPNPNAFSCKWCPYKEELCEYAHKGAMLPVRRKKPTY